MKVAVVIGHDSQEFGAYSPFLHKSEYSYNTEVAKALKLLLPTVVDVFERPVIHGERNDYPTQMKRLGDLIKSQNKSYELVIELHFNAYNGKAQGVETVSYAGNSFTKQWGMRFCSLVAMEYGSVNRGAKTVSTKTERGFGFLAAMGKFDAIILEPFFGDTVESLKFQVPERYANIIATCICG